MFSRKIKSIISIVIGVGTYLDALHREEQALICHVLRVLIRVIKKVVDEN